MPTQYEGLGRGGRGGGSGYTGGAGVARGGNAGTTRGRITRTTRSAVNKKATVKASGKKISSARKADKITAPTGPKKTRVKKINDKRKPKNKEYFSDGFKSEKYDGSFVSYVGKTKLNRGTTWDNYGINSRIIKGKNWKAQQAAIQRKRKK